MSRNRGTESFKNEIVMTYKEKNILHMLTKKSQKHGQIK